MGYPSWILKISKKIFFFFLEKVDDKPCFPMLLVWLHHSKAPLFVSKASKAKTSNVFGLYWTLFIGFGCCWLIPSFYIKKKPRKHDSIDHKGFFVEKQKKN